MGFDSLSASSSATTTAASGTSGTRRSLFAVQERRLDIPIDKIRPVLEYIQRRLAIRMLGRKEQTRSELINFVLVFGAAAVSEHVLMLEVCGDEAHEVSGGRSSRILRLIVLGYAILRLALGYDDLGRLVVENRRSRHHARLAVTVVVAIAELCRRSRVVAIGLRWHGELFVEGVEKRHSGGSGGRSSRQRVVIAEKTRVELGSVMRLMMQIERCMRRRLGDWDRARD